MSSDKRDAIGVSCRAKRLGHVDFLSSSVCGSSPPTPPILPNPNRQQQQQQQQQKQGLKQTFFLSTSPQ